MAEHVTIRCESCKQVVRHVCDEDFAENYEQLMKFVLEGGPSPGLMAAMKEYPTMYEEGDENAPFFSEAFLYCLVGKMNARTIRALIMNLARAAGIDPYEYRRPKPTDQS